MDHLIERAAARLRDANALHVPDHSTIEEDSPVPPRAPAPPFAPLTVPVHSIEAEPPTSAGDGASRPTFRPLVVPDGNGPPSDLSDAPAPGIRTGPLPAPPPPLTRPVSTFPPALTPVQAGAAVAQSHADPAEGLVQLDALERAGMVVARTSRTRISEEYRIAIGRILRVLHESGNKSGVGNLIMVTSARPGEGKTFSALNLAGSIAQNGTESVLLVDMDPKLRPLSSQLGLGEARGFLDLVSEPSLRPEDLLRPTAIPNLAIMPIGTRVGGAGQTVSGVATMRPIIPTLARLARRFPKHLVMLDAPPCLSTSDPHTMAAHVGQVVLVVEAERTQRVEVEAALDLVRSCPSVTLLLNKVRLTTSHTFGAYDYFGSYT